MNTVLYFEFTRNKKKIIRHILGWGIAFVILFVLTLLLDYIFPELNERCMKWPEMLKNLLGLPAWKRSLYGNIWQLMMLVSPFFLIYRLMSELSASIIQEERLETIVFLKNLSIKKGNIMLSKWLVCMAEILMDILVMLLINLLFLFLLQGKQMLGIVVGYYVGLFLVESFYSVIALFLASYRKNEAGCSDAILAILILPFLISRIPALLNFFVAVLEATGRSGELLEKMGSVADHLSVLTIVSPLTWCWTEIQVPWTYILCAVLIGSIMMVAAFGIYTTRQAVYEDR